MRGLTTASVWVVAAIGLAVDGGLYVTAVVATAIALVILAGLKPLEQRVVRRRGAPASARLALELDAALLPVREVVVTLQDAGLEVQRVRFRPGGSPNSQELDLAYTGDGQYGGQ